MKKLAIALVFVAAPALADPPAHSPNQQGVGEPHGTTLMGFSKEKMNPPACPHLTWIVGPEGESIFAKENPKVEIHLIQPKMEIHLIPKEERGASLNLPKFRATVDGYDAGEGSVLDFIKVQAEVMACDLNVFKGSK